MPLLLLLDLSGMISRGSETIQGLHEFPDETLFAALSVYEESIRAGDKKLSAQHLEELLDTLLMLAQRWRRPAFSTAVQRVGSFC